MTVPQPGVAIEPHIRALPKADLHVHQEASARRDRLVARRTGRPAYDWCALARALAGSPARGMARLEAIYAPDEHLEIDAADDSRPETFIARVADALEEGAAHGALLVEVRFGTDHILARPDFMALFRAAERRVQARYPWLVAEATGFLGIAPRPGGRERAELGLQACLRAARQGLAGLDLRVDPYDSEADPELWSLAYRCAERATACGLGITVHAGEFSLANLAAAARVPGVTRLGHAVYAAQDPALLDQIARAGITVECCLTSNVVLGAVPSYAAHPLRQLLARGVAVTLNTDLPVHACTSIGREYAIAAALGLSVADLVACTGNAIRAAFTSSARRAALEDELARRKAGLKG